MSRKKVCKTCRMLVEEDICPGCKGNQFGTTWKGRLYVADPENSAIAKKMGIAVKGEYAIKVK